MKISIFSPISSFESIKDFKATDEFKKMTKRHQAITVIASIFIGLFTLVVGGIFYSRMLIGRFRKLELDQESSTQAETAQKVDTQREANITAEQSQSTDKIQLFWEHHFGQMHSFLQMVFINVESEKIPGFLISNYTDFLEENHPDIILGPKDLDQIEKSIMRQMEENTHGNQKQVESLPPSSSINIDANVTRTFELTDNKSLIVFDTVADGTCGLHALVGEPQNGIFKCDGKKIRKEFCNWIRLHPEKVNLILDDYFLYIKEAPENFRNAVYNIHQLLFKDFPNLTYEEKNERKKQFREDPAVFNAYLENLEKVGTYLLQDELILAAEYFKKRIVFYQPGWGNDTRLGEGILNPNAKDEVVIYYNGINHYEHAIVLT